MNGHFVCQSCQIVLLDQVCHECGAQGTFCQGLDAVYHTPPAVRETVIKLSELSPQMRTAVRAARSLPRVSPERGHALFNQIRQTINP